MSWDAAEVTELTVVFLAREPGMRSTDGRPARLVSTYAGPALHPAMCEDVLRGVLRGGGR